MELGDWSSDGEGMGNVEEKEKEKKKKKIHGSRFSFCVREGLV